MELTEREKEFIDNEFQKLTAVINHVTKITAQQNTTDNKLRQFIVNAGIEIYRKM